MKKQELKQLILNYIETHPGTSFVELERLFEQNSIKFKGDYEYTAKDDENHIFWTGWQQEFFTLVSELVKDDLIEKNYAQPLIYYIDGKVLRLPVAKTPRKKKKPYWMPITFSFVGGVE